MFSPLIVKAKSRIVPRICAHVLAVQAFNAGINDYRLPIPPLLRTKEVPSVGWDLGLDGLGLLGIDGRKLNLRRSEFKVSCEIYAAANLM